MSQRCIPPLVTTALFLMLQVSARTVSAFQHHAGRSFITRSSHPSTTISQSFLNQGRRPPAFLSMESTSSESSSSSVVTAPPPAPTQPTPTFPRGAVSTVVRFGDPENDKDSTIPKYLLIERGNPPNRGVWCVPGGKIEWGETTIAAAQRELAEEVKFCDDNDVQVAWYSGAFCTSDSIQPGNAESGKPGYHYLIAQCFAEIVSKTEGGSSEPPNVQPADDAQDAKWWTLEEIREAQAKKETVPNLVIVIERAEELYQCGMLPTRIPETTHQSTES